MTDINLNHCLLHEPLILTIRGSGDGIRMGLISVSHIPGMFRTHFRRGQLTRTLGFICLHTVLERGVALDM